MGKEKCTKKRDLSDLSEIKGQSHGQTPAKRIEALENVANQEQYDVCKDMHIMAQLIKIDKLTA